MGASPRFINVVPRFPERPYTFTTALIETPDGHLHPRINS